MLQLQDFPLLQSHINNINSFTKSALLTDITESQFLWANFYAFLNFAIWMILPHLEFRYNVLSRFTKGDKQRAHDFLTFVLVQTGALRNLAFNEAMNNNIKMDYDSYCGFGFLIEAFGLVLVTVGFLLVIITFYRMGMRGMYFGDHFGFFFSEKITSFPFSHLENPQYVGTTCFFFGSAMYYHSPAGAVLTVVTYVLYKVLNVIESKKLEEFYPSSKSGKKE
jgi:phosphatidylethanolamine/phosphatidyl-N-methylethanolamine N-methyltransferase